MRSNYSSEFQLPTVRSSGEQRAQGHIQTAYGNRPGISKWELNTPIAAEGRMNKTSPPPVLLFPSLVKREIFEIVPKTSWVKQRKSRPKSDKRTIYHLTRDKTFYRL